MRLTFDHGTLLLFDLAAASELPGLTWDPRVSAFRAAARWYTEIKTELERRGVPYSDTVPKRGAAPGAFAPIGLRDYQARALASWQGAQKRGVIVLPTGAGKTRVALAAMAQTRLRALCLVPTRALLEQWRQILASVYHAEIGCLGDGRQVLAPVTLATFESAYRWMARIGDTYDLLIVDEAHHFGAGLRDEALEMCAARARLGLTATPPESPEARQKLHALIGATVFENSVADLSGTYLAELELITCRLGLNPAERNEYASAMADFERVHAEFRRHRPLGSWPEFIGAAVRTEPGRRALAGWHSAKRLLAYTSEKRAKLKQLLAEHREARVLVFTADNATAYRVAREELIMPITCDIDRRERGQALACFRDGKLRALVSARVLNEGIDVPDADVAVIVAGTLGKREHTQRIGRLLRPAPGKRARVYELVTVGTVEVAQARRRNEHFAANAFA